MAASASFSRFLISPPSWSRSCQKRPQQASTRARTLGGSCNAYCLYSNTPNTTHCTKVSHRAVRGIILRHQATRSASRVPRPKETGESEHRTRYVCVAPACSPPQRFVHHRVHFSRSRTEDDGPSVISGQHMHGSTSIDLPSVSQILSVILSIAVSSRLPSSCERGRSHVRPGGRRKASTRGSKLWWARSYLQLRLKSAPQFL